MPLHLDIFSPVELMIEVMLVGGDPPTTPTTITVRGETRTSDGGYVVGYGQCLPGDPQLEHPPLVRPLYPPSVYRRRVDEAHSS